MLVLLGIAIQGVDGQVVLRALLVVLRVLAFPVALLVVDRVCDVERAGAAWQVALGLEGRGAALAQVVRSGLQLRDAVFEAVMAHQQDPDDQAQREYGCDEDG